MMRKLLFILAPFIVIGASLLFLGHLPKAQQASATVTMLQQIVPTESPFPSSSPTIARNDPVSDTVNDANGRLNAALIKKYGFSGSFVTEISIDGYAQGTLKGSGKQNKWWLAKLRKNGWSVVADGYSYVNCSDASDFPRSVVPVCWGKNTLVYR